MNNIKNDIENNIEMIWKNQPTLKINHFEIENYLAIQIGDNISDSVENACFLTKNHPYSIIIKQIKNQLYE